MYLQLIYCTYNLDVPELELALQLFSEQHRYPCGDFVSLAVVVVEFYVSGLYDSVCEFA